MITVKFSMYVYLLNLPETSYTKYLTFDATEYYSSTASSPSSILGAYFSAQPYLFFVSELRSFLSRSGLVHQSKTSGLPLAEDSSPHQRVIA